MSLTLTEIKHIAHLARLELNDDETQAILAQLNALFSLIDQMQSVDTTGIEPLAHPGDQLEPAMPRPRDDIICETIIREANQRCAPAVQDGLYLVPRVIE